MADKGFCECMTGPVLCKHIRALARELGGLEQFGLSAWSRTVENVASAAARECGLDPSADEAGSADEVQELVRDPGYTALHDPPPPPPKTSRAVNRQFRFFLQALINSRFSCSSARLFFLKELDEQWTDVAKAGDAEADAMRAFVDTVSEAAHTLFLHARDAGCRRAMDTAIRMLHDMRSGKQRTRYPHSFTKHGKQSRRPSGYKKAPRRPRPRGMFTLVMRCLACANCTGALTLTHLRGTCISREQLSTTAAMTHVSACRTRNRVDQ